MTAAADVAALELGAQRGGARRRIAWDALADVPAGDVRAFAGAEWLERMKQEHLAVGAFSRMAVELAEEGCDDVVLFLVARAAADEVRHAEVCRNVAVKLLDAGAVPRRLRGVPRIPEHPSAAPADRALYHVVEMCCLSETVTGVWFTEAIARATHPTMRAVLESLLEDEIDHGKVGWAYLAARAGEKRLGQLAAELPAMIDRVFCRPAPERRPIEPADGAALEALGTLTRATARAVVRRALFDVALPGFEAVGVDVGPARARAAERGL